MRLVQRIWVNINESGTIFYFINYQLDCVLWLVCISDPNYQSACVLQLIRTNLLTIRLMSPKKVIGHDTAYRADACWCKNISMNQGPYFILINYQLDCVLWSVCIRTNFLTIRPMGPKKVIGLDTANLSWLKIITQHLYIHIMYQAHFGGPTI